jgi:hypothetical protein
LVTARDSESEQSYGNGCLRSAQWNAKDVW